MKPEAEKTPSSSVMTLLALARQRLSRLDSGDRDAEYLLAHATGQTRTWLHTWPEKTIGASGVRLFDCLVRERANGMPLAYLTGEREFWSLPLRVSRDTLIPRPETERLVELTLLYADDASVIVDLGTGCGAIAIAIAGELHDKTIIATDISASALAVAGDNARRLDCKIQFVRCDWLTGFATQSIDLIVSNPPYIASGDAHLGGDGVLFEPEIALVGGADGLDAYRRLIPDAARALSPSGMLLLEHGHDQAAAVGQLMANAGLVDLMIHQDDAGLDRVSTAKARTGVL